jgi:hypothetical protein
MLTENSMEFHEIPWNGTEVDGISWNFMEFHEIRFRQGNNQLIH